MKWEDLNKKDQNFWDNIAKNHQKALFFIKNLRDFGCYICHKIMEPTFEAMAFHIQSAHGLPREVLVEAIIQQDEV